MVFSSSSQVIIIAPILPRIGAALDIPATLLGTLITSYAVMLSLFALIMGPISDKFGRRRVLLIGSVSMSVALFLHGIADSYVSLLTVRAVAGAAGGALSGAAVAYVGDYFPYERRGWANGWVMSGIAFGQIIGVPIGTLLADLFGFRWPFLMFAVSMLLAAILIWRVVPQPDVQRDANRLSVGGALSNYAALLRRPEVTAVSVVYFLMFFSLGLYITYLPTWLEGTLHVNGTHIASLFFAGGIANVVTGPLAGRMSDRIGRKPLIVTSCVGLGIIMVLTTYLVGNMLAAYLMFAAAMVMVAMRISPFQSLVSSLVTGERRGALMSLTVALGQIGVGIGGGVAGMVYTRYGFFSNTLVGALTILIMAYLVQQWIPEPDQLQAPLPHSGSNASATEAAPVR
jgi:predicted MFS family arabinose efflux permease